VALCDNLPLVASTVMGNTPTVADGETENVTDSLVPGVREKEGGVASTPCGTPWKVNSTELLKPCSGTTETVTAEVEFPRTAEVETGDADTPKSGPGGGWDGVTESPPQHARTTKDKRVHASFVVRNIPHTPK